MDILKLEYSTKNGDLYDFLLKYDKCKYIIFTSEKFTFDFSGIIIDDIKITLFGKDYYLHFDQLVLGDEICLSHEINFEHFKSQQHISHELSQILIDSEREKIDKCSCALKFDHRLYVKNKFPYNGLRIYPSICSVKFLITEIGKIVYKFGRERLFSEYMCFDIKAKYEDISTLSSDEFIPNLQQLNVPIEPTINIQTTSDICIVTAYFELPERAAKRMTQSYDYLKCSKETLMLPHNMVIYVSENLAEFVAKTRERMPNTKIVIIKDLPYKDLLPILEINCIKNQPPYNKPDYIRAVQARYEYLLNAITNSYFDNNYYCWIDFAASHAMTINLQSMVVPISDKVRISLIARLNHHGTFTYFWKTLGGGLFLARKDIMMDFCKRHIKFFYKLSLIHRLNVNDDKILFLIYENNPYLFDCYTSSYKSMFEKMVVKF